jgi:hypothetical protein
MFHPGNKAIRTQRRIGFVIMLLPIVFLLLVAMDVVNVGPGQSKTYTIGFEIGTETDELALSQVAAIVSTLAEHPTLGVVITGHTGRAGDAEANQQLSQNRADVIAGMLIKRGIPQSRIISLGAAGSLPPTRKNTESDASFNRRLPRTVIAITPVKYLNFPRAG